MSFLNKLCGCISKPPETYGSSQSDTTETDSGYKSDAKSSKENESSASPDESKSKEIIKFKLLLVGAGEAGKSTFFKIITRDRIKLYTNESDLLEFVESIHGNIIESVQTIVNQCNDLKLYTAEDGTVYDCRISESLQDEVEAILSVDVDELTPEIAETIKKLLEDEGFNTCLTKLRHLYYIPDGATYFFEHIDRIGADNYVPVFKDILSCRDRTTGVTHEEMPYVLDGQEVLLDLYDVGGQRNERKAWQNIFKEVDVICYVTACGEYNQTTIEDNETNRINESMVVLNVLSRSPHFKKTPIGLTITKEDQMAKKLKQGIPFNLKPPDNGTIMYEPYTGDNSLESVKEYLEDLCKQMIGPGKKVVTSFVNLVADNVEYKEQLDELLRAALVNMKKRGGG